MVKLIHYLDVMSSWCYYAEPAVERLRRKYGSKLAYEWRISLVADRPASRAQVEWFYKRSGSISGTHLNPSWFAGAYPDWDFPNLAAEAARELGFSDDRVRLALSHAALIDGVPLYERREAAKVVAAVTGVDTDKILAQMDDAKMSERIKQTSKEFDALHIDQRPAFVLRSNIGDTAIFSGIWVFEPLDATVDAMLRDVDQYAKFASENPPLPAAR